MKWLNMRRSVDSVNTHSKGTSISTSYNVTASLVSSYSSETSTVPSFDGVGQALTRSRVNREFIAKQD